MARIILVDDSDFIIETCAEHLRSGGHEIVATARDGIEGFEAYKAHRPDLILLDLTMPNRDGRECLMDILTHDAEARVVVVSAVRDAAVVVECLRAGARSFVKKPLRWRDPDFRADFDVAIATALE